MLLHWARGVFVEVFYVLASFRPIVNSMGEGDANTSCPGQKKGMAGRRAAAGRCCRQAECSPAGTRTSTLTGGITDQHWVGRVKTSFCKNHDSGGLHQLGVRSCQLFS